MDPETGTSENRQDSTNDTVNDATSTDESTDNGQSTQSTATEESTASVGEALDAFSRELGRPIKEEKSTEKPDASVDGDSTDKTITDNKPSLGKKSLPTAGDPAVAIQARDYSGLDDEEKQLFKHMGNKQYAAFYPKLIKAKALEGEVATLKQQLAEKGGSVPYDIEQGYKLDANYTKLSNAATRLEAEESYWEQQLALVESDGEFTDITYDAATGNYTYDAPIKVTPENKIQLKNHLNKMIRKSNNIQQRLQGELEGFQSKYAQQYETYKSSMVKARDSIVGQLTPEQHKGLEKAVGNKLALFPEFKRNSMEIKMLAEALVFLDGFAKMVQELKGQINGKAIVGKTARAAGPTNVNGGAATGGKNTAGSILEEFHKAGFHHR